MLFYNYFTHVSSMCHELNPSWAAVSTFDLFPLAHARNICCGCLLLQGMHRLCGYVLVIDLPPGAGCPSREAESKKSRNFRLSALAPSAVEDSEPSLMDEHSSRPAILTWCDMRLLTLGSRCTRTDPTFGLPMQAPNRAPHWTQGKEEPMPLIHMQAA